MVPQKLPEPRAHGRGDLICGDHVTIPGQQPQPLLPVYGHWAAGLTPEPLKQASYVQDAVVGAPLMNKGEFVQYSIAKGSQSRHLLLRDRLQASCVEGPAGLQHGLHSTPVSRKVHVGVAPMGALESKVPPEQVVHGATTQSVTASSRQSVQCSFQRAPLEHALKASTLRLDTKLPELQQQHRGIRCRCCVHGLRRCRARHIRRHGST
mmetsp:Transcript_129910/g.259143  ORF Transcript_129910/g.259143 Transcript_129910/m.259143 type:complete len:208 (-) Transcript_129910:51-674(-)